MMRFPDRDFNATVLALAARLPYVASPHAPADHTALFLATRERGQELIVWDGASDRTLYGDPRVNHAFRAWHDSAGHVATLAPFDWAGEHRACDAQIRDLLSNVGDNAVTRAWANVVRAEIIGQLEYERGHGVFPTDQVAFVVAYLADPVAALRHMW